MVGVWGRTSRTRCSHRRRPAPRRKSVSCTSANRAKHPPTVHECDAKRLRRPLRGRQGRLVGTALGEPDRVANVSLRHGGSENHLGSLGLGPSPVSQCWCSARRQSGSELPDRSRHPLGLLLSTCRNGACAFQLAAATASRTSCDAPAAGAGGQGSGGAARVTAQHPGRAAGAHLARMHPLLCAFRQAHAHPRRPTAASLALSAHASVAHTSRSASQRNCDGSARR